jgi:hypothetical protein
MSQTTMNRFESIVRPVGLWAIAAIFLCNTVTSVKVSAQTPEIEGQKLVAKLRDLRPAQAFNNTGTMEIRRADRHRVPVYLKTVVQGENWLSIYGTGQSPTLVIAQSHDGPNTYVSLPPAGVREIPNFDQRRDLRNSLIPFAGSDFWLFDLGMEFLQWNRQRIVGTDTRKTQKCYVLESINPIQRRGAYSRVKSWVDMDSMAMITAEAYDSQGKLWKRFEPKKLKKVDGKWRLKEIEMRNFRTDSKTTLIFDRELE